MRILYLDIDTTRPDHLGCYGYHRNTCPNLDKIAEQGLRFENCYVSDAPCLPSRASQFSGRFGIHTDAINHGGTTADPRRTGESRGFKDPFWQESYIMQIAKAGYYPVSISPFAERHSSWWFYAGWREMYNTGMSGGERADQIWPVAEKWLNDNAEDDKWFLHINMWDPHTTYDVPVEFGNPFEDDPVADWITEEKIQKDREMYGPHSAQETMGYRVFEHGPDKPHAIGEIKNLDDYKTWIDGYDRGIRYMDHYIGKILAILEEKGVLEDTAIIMSSDHGENQGELGVYGDHQNADHITSRVPYIMKWPGVGPGVYQGIHYQNDIAATVVELAGGEVPKSWDGYSVADEVKNGKENARDYVVVSNNAWSCQRAVRWDNWIMIKTYHTGLKPYPEYMLFDLDSDPHELTDLAEEKPELVHKGAYMLEKWHSDMMRTSTSDTDPMWTTMAEGGPLHARAAAELPTYCRRLRETGRGKWADMLEKIGGDPIDFVNETKR